MSFQNKMQDFFKDFDTIPTPNESKHLKHIYADFVELVALFSNEDYTTSTNISRRFSREGDSLIEESEIEEIESEIPNDEIASMNTEIRDEEEKEVNEIFEILKSRVVIFKNSYPFDCDGSKIRLKNNLSNIHKLYLGLLVSSNLDIFKKIQPELTSEFEIISFQAIQNFMPLKAIKKQFGKKSDYKGTAQEKVKALASDMNLDTHTFELDQISLKNTQEKGLDLVAWIPFEDKSQNILVLLAQCACGKEWYKKYNETRRYENYLHFYKLKPIHSLWIPYALLDVNGKFFQSDEIRDILLFERSRILEYIFDTDFFESLNTKFFIDSCIDKQESVI